MLPRSLCYVFLFFIFFTSMGQKDTVYVKKDPVVIQKEVYYAAPKDADSFKHSLRFLVANFAGSSVDIESSNYNKIQSEGIKKNRQEFSLLYEHKIGKIELGTGFGFSQFGNQVTQQGYPVFDRDSTQKWKSDTLDEYFVDDIPQYVIDSTQFWEYQDTSATEVSKSTIRSAYLSIPLCIGTSFYKGKFTFSVAVAITNYFRINQKGKVIFKDENQQEKEVTQIFHRNHFATFAPELSISYRFYKGLNAVVNYQSVFGLNKVYGLYDKKLGATSAFGIGLKQQF